MHCQSCVTLITKKLQLDSDEEALRLLGEQDVRLRDMEKRFGVEVFVRHDPSSEAVTLSIRGQTNRVDKALRWLKDFRSQLKYGAGTAPPALRRPVLSGSTALTASGVRGLALSEVEGVEGVAP